MTVTAMPPTSASETPETPPGEKKSTLKVVILTLVAVLALGGGGYWFLAPKPPAPAKPGAVVQLDSIQINLAAAHYLRLGIALQLTDKANDVDGSKALDAAISLFSGQNMADVNQAKHRDQLKADLEATLDELYDGKVMGVYFTEYVTQ